MCIIAYLKKGKDISDERIRFMFKANPDGAGIMWKPRNTSNVEIHKGFMDVDELIAAYREIPKNCERAIHMRIATAGKVSTDCCHPFPVRKKVGSMRNAIDNADIALMHNGIIDYCNPKNGLNETYSDSMVFATMLYCIKEQLDSKVVQTLIKESSPSRFLIMRKDKSTIMIGNWCEDDGVYYSNRGYKEWPVPKVYSDTLLNSPYYSNSSFGTAYQKAYSGYYECSCNNLSGNIGATGCNDNVGSLLDVEYYFNYLKEEGFEVEEIERRIEDDLYYDILSFDNCDIVDMHWINFGAILYVETIGIPLGTDNIGGFPVIDSHLVDEIKD